MRPCLLSVKMHHLLSSPLTVGHNKQKAVLQHVLIGVKNGSHTSPFVGYYEWLNAIVLSIIEENKIIPYSDSTQSFTSQNFNDYVSCYKATICNRYFTTNYFSLSNRFSFLEFTSKKLNGFKEHIKLFSRHKSWNVRDW